MTQKFVILAGPTATGKTKLAVALSQQFPLTLISADSRQVYRQTNIVTGKDHPPNLKIHCLDLCWPNEEISISQWFTCASKTAQTAWHQQKLPFFVGGTGFYLKALTSNIQTMFIPPNQNLRSQLNRLTIPQLQTKLQQLNPQKFSQLNPSDRSNPRRLVRAIEVSLYLKVNPLPSPSNPFLQASYLYFVLSPPSNYLSLIKKRVIRRLELGAIQETKFLMDQYGPNSQVFDSLGYPLIVRYLNQEITYSHLIKLWTQAEYAYAKRQLVWFKKQPQTIWLSTRDQPLPVVAKRLQTWYHKNI